MSDSKEDFGRTASKRAPSHSSDIASSTNKSKKKQAASSNPKKKKDMNPFEKLDSSYISQPWAPLVTEQTVQLFTKEKDWKAISMKVSKPKRSLHAPYKRNLPQILSNLNLKQVPIFPVVENAYLPYCLEFPNIEDIPAPSITLDQDDSTSIMNDSQQNNDNTLDDDPNNKKKSKKESKPKKKASKPKIAGPVDLERQCGVIGPNGKPCLRTITCKTHSVALKRAVMGRSTTYDDLVRRYHQNNAKLKAEQLKSQNKTETETNDPLTKEIEEESDYDSDKELETILECLRNRNLQPVASRPLFNTRNNYQNFIVRNIISGTLRDLPK